MKNKNWKNIVPTLLIILAAITWAAMVMACRFPVAKVALVLKIGFGTASTILAALWAGISVAVEAAAVWYILRRLRAGK